ncbi:MAG: single-stranded-DNA-specific exonuclease RecJ [Bryobacterales bacterium]|nr:single-stranded-DNA-specific exonuclease RecJ [Bryobacterales bacterium]
MSARWHFPDTNGREAEELARALAVQLPAARVLRARGFRDPLEARRFLHPSLDDLYDPLLLKGMREAVARVRRAVDAGERILIYGDYDVDGAASVVILKKAIEMAGGRCCFHVPDRLRDGYGMRPEVAGQAAALGASLIISVDTGIRAGEAVRCAAASGIDAVITDHHLPEAELPPACAVINPNQPGCPYPEKNLCGAGVALKLAQAVLATSGRPAARLRMTLESFLKLVAIATVADVVPLTGENRVIVKHGLEGLRSVRNPGLRALLDVAGFAEGSAPSAGQVAFRIAPRLNAAGRMATADDVIELFLTADPARARTLAARLHEWNAERQETEAAIVRSILQQCEEAPVTDGQAALVFAGRDWHRGVLGIVANRLVERFHRPAIVLSCDAESGLAQGSGRSISGFHLLEALEAIQDLFLRFGGHRHAVGLTLPAGRVDEFRNRLNERAATFLTPEDFHPQIAPDALLDLREVNEQSVAEVLALAPFGCGNPTPLFALKGAEVAGPAAVWKEKHLRLTLRQQSRTLTLKAWNLAGEAPSLPPGARVDAAVTFEPDPLGWSAVLRHVRPVSD